MRTSVPLILLPALGLFSSCLVALSEFNMMFLLYLTIFYFSFVVVISEKPVLGFLLLLLGGLLFLFFVFLDKVSMCSL